MFCVAPPQKNVVSTFGFAIAGPMFNPKRRIQILSFHCKDAVMTSIIFWKFDPDELTIELSIVIICWFIGLRIPLMDDDNPQYIENYSYYSAPSKFCTWRACDSGQRLMQFAYAIHRFRWYNPWNNHQQRLRSGCSIKQGPYVVSHHSPPQKKTNDITMFPSGQYPIGSDWRKKFSSLLLLNSPFFKGDTTIYGFVWRIGCPKIDA